MMQEILVQLVVLLLVAILAAIKSLRFTPSALTDFELQRQVRQGKAAALLEQRLRREQPLLLELQQLAILLLIIIIIVCLRSAYSFFAAILFACIWLLFVELLSTRHNFRSFVEELADNHLMRLLSIEDALRPMLRFLVDQDEALTKEATFYSKDELVYAMEHDHGVLSKDEIAYIKQAFVYGQITIQDVMTPRSHIETIKFSDTIGPLLLDRLHKTQQRVFPVVKKDMDHIVGIVDMTRLLEGSSTAKTVADVMDRNVDYVQETLSLDHVLEAFLRTGNHLFIVVNRSERTTGIIGIEGIFERILGRKIVDKFDRYEDLRSVAQLAATGRDTSALSKTEKTTAKE